MCSQSKIIPYQCTWILNLLLVVLQGYRVIPDTEANTQHGGDRPWCCQTEPESAVVGIGRLWVYGLRRHQGIGSKLVDCVRWVGGGGRSAVSGESRVGIGRLWVYGLRRHQGIGSKLVDCVRWVRGGGLLAVGVQATETPGRRLCEVSRGGGRSAVGVVRWVTGGGRSAVGVRATETPGRRGWVLSGESRVGIGRLWVYGLRRHQGISSKLVDCVRWVRGGGRLAVGVQATETPGRRLCEVSRGGGRSAVGVVTGGGRVGVRATETPGRRLCEVSRGWVLSGESGVGWLWVYGLRRHQGIASRWVGGGGWSAVGVRGSSTVWGESGVGVGRLWVYGARRLCEVSRGWGSVGCGCTGYGDTVTSPRSLSGESGCLG